MAPTTRSLLVITTTAAACLTPAGTAPADDLAATLDELFGRHAEGRPIEPDPEWRPGHETVVWFDDATHGAPALMEYDPTTGDRRTLVDPVRWRRSWARHGRGAPDLTRLVWRPDGAAFLVTGGEDPGLYDLSGPTSKVIETGPGVEAHASYSPDGSRIAWVRDNDLFIYDLEADQEIRLTDDGSDTVFNGVFDWVYTEELAGRDPRAYEWSPDGASLVWLRLDDSAIPVHHLVDVMAVHSRVTEQRYPKPGDPSPVPSLHVVAFGASSKPDRRHDIRFDQPTPYVPRFGFTATGDLWYQLLDRAQERIRLIRVAATDSTKREILVDETDPFWLEPVDGMRILDDGSLLWLSRRTGHSHLHRFFPDGRHRDLTPGPWDVTELVGVDPEDGLAWVQAARPTARDRRLYRIELEGGATVELSSAPGTHDARLSPSADRLLITSSSAGSPPRRRVVDGTGAGAAAVPVEHPVPRMELADHRFVQITAADGVVLDAMLLMPPGFDSTNRYPAVVFVYGGPHAQVVRDRWPSISGLFNHALADAGYVVFALDTRGAAGRGRDFEGAVDHALGSSQLPDHLAGVAWLAARDWIDSERIGIWGWSYGGYMAAYALTRAPGTFAAGAAVAPVTDWRLYDSIYTERYMASPGSNPEGYSAGSVLDAVDGLTDPLLVIHGTGDDNVHVQHTLQLADRAWRAGVRFNLMLLPNLGHGLDDADSRRQVFGAVAGFLDGRLSPAP